MPLPNGAAIKAIRLAKKLTGTEVARACGITHGHLYNIENPERRTHASDQVLDDLAAKLEVPRAAIEMPQPAKPRGPQRQAA
jgi:transcriptional regulator with XRE-family HTH domain